MAYNDKSAFNRYTLNLSSFNLPINNVFIFDHLYSYSFLEADSIVSVELFFEADFGAEIVAIIQPVFSHYNNAGFNHYPFNNTLFNLAINNNFVFDSLDNLDFANLINADIGIAAISAMTARYSDVIESSFVLRKGTYVDSPEQSSRFYQDIVRLLPFWWLEEKHTGSIVSEFVLSNRTFLTVSSNDYIQRTNAVISAEIMVVSSNIHASTIDSFARHSIKIYISIEFENQIIVDTSIYTLHIIECKLTLPYTNPFRPGETIIIDADTYNVFKQGVNVIYMHSGDWIDSLERTTEKIEVTANGASSVKKEITYTERYL